MIGSERSRSKANNTDKIHNYDDKAGVRNWNYRSNFGKVYKTYLGFYQSYNIAHDVRYGQIYNESNYYFMMNRNGYGPHGYCRYEYVEYRETNRLNIRRWMRIACPAPYLSLYSKWNGQTFTSTKFRFNSDGINTGTSTESGAIYNYLTFTRW